MVPRRDDGPSFASILNIAQQANLEDEQEVKKLLRAAAATQNPALRRRIKKALEARAAQHTSYPFNESKTGSEIRLGETPTGDVVGLNHNDFMTHVLVAGQSGSGKTTLFYNMMHQLEVPFWSFDLKQDYRHLASERSDLLVLPWNQLRFNPLQPPPDVSTRRWAQVITEIFGHATALLSGSKNYLFKTLHQLYDDTKSEWPTLHDLHDAVTGDNINYMRKSSNYRDTVANRLNGILLSCPDVFDTSQGFIQPPLLDHDIVFEFDGLTNDTQNFLMEALFAYVYEYRLAQAQRGGGLRHVFFLDEGKRVFSVYKERQDAAGIPTVDELTAKMREFGEGLVVADQEPSKLTDSIKANTEVKILLSMGDRKQFREMAESMDLKPRQRAHAKQLDTGESIVQRGNTPPLLVELDHVEVEKSVTDDRLQELQGDRWKALSLAIKHVVDEATTREDTIFTESEDQRDTGEQSERDGDGYSEGEEPVSEDAMRLLRSIVEEPFISVSERYDRFSSVHKGNKAKKELIERGLIEDVSVNTENGRIKLFELSGEGRDVLADHGVEVRQEGRGGVEHRYWQHKIQDRASDAGWSASLEEEGADVSLERDGRRVAVEIAMGPNDREIEHVKQRLATRFDHVVIACPSRDVVDALADRVEKSGVDGERADVRFIQDLFDGDRVSL